jgi:hypothetical protein
MGVERDGQRGNEECDEQEELAVSLHWLGNFISEAAAESRHQPQRDPRNLKGGYGFSFAP